MGTLRPIPLPISHIGKIFSKEVFNYENDLCEQKYL